MPRNIEIKARIASVDALAAALAGFADDGPLAIAQDDTFFRCDKGRLKLRSFDATHGELIFYRRADSLGPKESHYTIAPTAAPDALREVLTMALGTTGRVRKARTLFLVGRTRVHLDRVEGLGEFLELEVVLRDGEANQAGIDEAHALMARLGVQQSQLIDTAYVDLLNAAR
ncbi:MAG: class IV adenylate cyclase [Burkholderiaceae bacterium]